MIRLRKRTLKFILLSILVAVLCIAVVVICILCCGDDKGENSAEMLSEAEMPDFVTVDYIDIGRARTAKPLKEINNIVIHYIGNPNTTAKQNRSYFANPDTVVCSHFIVGLDGEVLQCVPLNEQSAASNHRNVDTVSIEVCHPDETGRFNEATYASLVRLTAWLCSNSELNENDLIRHHDITGKQCPKHFVDFPDEWERFKNDVKQQLE